MNSDCFSTASSEQPEIDGVSRTVTFQSNHKLLELVGDSKLLGVASVPVEWIEPLDERGQIGQAAADPLPTAPICATSAWPGTTWAGDTIGTAMDAMSQQRLKRPQKR